MHDNNGMKNNVLKMENTSMQFGGVLALNNLNLDVYEGEIVGLIGPNGAGKTSFIRTIVGRIPPLAGSFRLGGATKLGYMAQEQDHMHGPDLMDLQAISKILRYQM